MVLWSIIKFSLKFIVFAFVWTYFGRAIGLIFLVGWIILSRFKGKGSKTADGKVAPRGTRDKSLHRSFPEYY